MRAWFGRAQLGRAQLVQAALGLALVLGSARAEAAPHYYVELPEEGLDRPTTLRAVALELRDVDVPGDPLRPGDSSAEVSLFLRIRSETDHWLVELWDRGERVGARRVSKVGQPGVVARRVALSTVELARQLTVARHRNQKRLDSLRARREREAKTAHARRLVERNGLLVGLDTIVLPDRAFLVGPTLGWLVNRDFPFRLRFDLGYRSGSLGVGGSPDASWSAFEARLGASRVTRFSGFEADAGGFVTFDALRAYGAATFEGPSFERTSFTSRAGIELAATVPLDPNVGLRLGLSGGLLLRSVPLRVAESRGALEGGFVGVALGVVLSPPVPLRARGTEVESW